jgi:hypothetical protein
MSYIHLKTFQISNQEHVLNDITLAITGTTIVDQFSESCDKTYTTIDSTLPTNWTLVDDTLTDRRIIKSPYVNFPAEYKFVEIEITDGYLRFYGWELWNEVTHTGINRTNNTGNNSKVRWSTTYENTFYIISLPEYVAIQTNYNVSIWGDPNYAGMMIVSEFSTDLPTQINPDGSLNFPAFCVIYTGSTFRYNETHKNTYLTRIRDKNSNYLVGKSIYCYAEGTIPAFHDDLKYFPQGNSRMKLLDDRYAISMIPLLLGEADVFSSKIGVVSDIWALPKNGEFRDGDTFEIYPSSEIYISIYAGQNHYLAFRLS